MNLQRANLDRDTYFKIFEILQRHRKIDVDDFELELIHEALTIKCDLLCQLDNFKREHDERIRLLCDIAAGMSEVLDFLESKKSMNLRKPKEMPKKTILNLRNKLKVFSM
jgi:hypothetical protein